MILYKNGYRYEQRSQNSKIKQYFNDVLLSVLEALPAEIVDDYTLMKEMEKDICSFFEYDVNSDKTLVLTKIKKDLPSTVVIPNKIDNCEVVKLDDNLFIGQEYIEAVILPDTIKLIGNHCFSGCCNLHTVKLSENLEYIPKYCFHHCTALQNIDLKNIVIIANNAFSGTTCLEKVNLENARIFESNAFSESGLKKVSLPKVDTLREGVFSYCPNLETVEISSKNIFEICNDTFFCDSKLKQIILPDTLRIIRQSAFFECMELEHIELPRDLHNIEENAFALSGLKNIEINGDVRFKKEAFSNARELEEVIINANIEELPKDIFKSCTNLKKIILPKKYNVKVAMDAFSKCTNLNEVVNSENITVAMPFSFSDTAIKNIKLSKTTEYNKDSFPSDTKIEIVQKEIDEFNR